MTEPTENTKPDLSLSITMIQMVTSFWLCRAIYVAASLGICDILKQESRGFEELAEMTGSHAPSLYRMLRALASAGILTEQQYGRFALTPLGATLCTDVPGSLNAWVRVQLGEEHYRAWGDPLHSVRTGEIAFDHVFGMGVWKYRAENEEHAKLFDEAMANLTGIYNTAVLSSYSFSRFQRIIDVGGGDGGLLIAILKENPKLTGVLVDIPHVAEKARTRIGGAGLMDRCQVVAGDAFNSVPEGGDAYILSRVVHDWDDSRSIVLLKNCHRAMDANGRLIVIEGVIAPDNEPSITKYFDLNMMILNGGCERTAKDYQSLFQVAGFKLVGITPTQSAMSVLEAEKA